MKAEEEDTFLQDETGGETGKDISAALSGS